MLQVELEKRFHAILNKIPEVVKSSGYAVKTVHRFRDCITPIELGGAERLPLYSKNGRSGTSDKVYCILCLISYTLQLYWRLCLEEMDQTESVKNNLDLLDKITEKGLDSFKVAGNIVDKYYLVEK